MCGVTGFVTTTPVPGGVVQLGRMTEALRHRGPDDFGFYHDDFAHLGHRRLSIVDVSGGHQPLSNETGSLWITYNGEIYNHADLRPALEQAGHRYRTRSDTETILHAYEQHGAASLVKLRGMFAFAIWDSRRRRLFCARDRVGIKPFYYFWNGRLFAFASEIKALLKHTEISTTLDEETFEEVLAFGYTSGARTLFGGIRKLLPGHHLTFDLATGDRCEDSPEPRIERYWDAPCPDSAGSSAGIGDREWIAETRRHLEDAVERHRMSDVPLGVFLSGGVDSSAVAALLRQSTREPLQTFAVGYPEAGSSELAYAADVAGVIGSEHREVVIGAGEFFDALPRLIWHEDEPIAWPSSVALYFVSKLAAGHVKVAFTGEGADELFGGYERYAWHAMNQRLAAIYRMAPGPLRRWIRSQTARSPLLRASVRRRLGHTVLGRERRIESLFLDNFYCAFSREERERVLAASRSNSVYKSYLGHFDAHPDAPPLARLLHADQKTYLVELLMKQDQMSMAASLESRVPFLDHTLVEFAMRIPDRLKIRGRSQKYVLKQAIKDLLPRRIIHRRKMGFPTPLRSWLLDARAQPLYTALRSGDGLLPQYLDRREVEALIQRHQSGFDDATDRIWRLLNLQIWGDLFLTGRPERWFDGAKMYETARSAS